MLCFFLLVLKTCVSVILGIMYTNPELKRFDYIYEYQKILCPDYPEFLDDYIALPILQRLDGIGLLCGTDWTPLYNNQFFYTRLEHSIGCALIAWNFTHDKKQTLAALLHDVSTPVFSHVNDFRKGDVLHQEATEDINGEMIMKDAYLAELLQKDAINAWEIHDYHIYPVCDNEVPQLSCDRLEYMYPSGMALNKSFDMDSVRRTYSDISVLKNEYGIDELGFNTVEIAEEYCERCCNVGLVLQKNENKLALNLLGKILNTALEVNYVSEKDFYQMSEKRMMELLSQCSDKKVKLLFDTFTSMTEIEHTDSELPDSYCVSLNVKKRYINPLVRKNSDTKEGVRISSVSEKAFNAVNNFLRYEDTEWGCVKLHL